jgi:short subunit dehydrogenase-like uncharacterized protein
VATTDLSNCLIYGAYGFTGDLTARLAVERGLKPILAGRSEAKGAPLAAELGLPWRTVGLDDGAALEAALDGVDVVIHAAGPFSRTSRPMVDACIRSGTHYTDITGEIAVFEACAARDAEAEAAGVLLMPGTGFDVVPTDCLAAHLAGRLPDAQELTLAFRTIGGATSHGTAMTMVESLGMPGFVRRDGRITPIRAGSLVRDVDFGRGPKKTMAIPWGDISTAYHSTGIPSIETYMSLPPVAIRAQKVVARLGWLMRSGPVQRLLRRRVEAAPAGPTAEQRASGITLVWGEARAGDRAVQARLKTPEGYTLTARTSLEIARRIADGQVEPGFRTPSKLFGADFILEFEGVERTEL